MNRLLIITLVTAAIRTQIASGQQPSSCGAKTSPFYNLLSSSYLSKYQALQPKNNAFTSQNPSPQPCTCSSCSPPQYPLPPIAARTLQLMNSVGSRVGMAGVPALSGIVVYSPGFLQQTGPATILQTPPPVSVPPSQLAPVPPVDPDYYTTTSHIMTIPKKYSSDSPPSITYTSTPVSDDPNSLPSPNSIYSVVPPPPPAAPSRPFYYTQPPPYIASCPATVLYPATQAVSYTQPPAVTYSVLPAPPPPTPNIYTPPPSFPPVIQNNLASSATAAAAAASTSSAAAAAAASSSAGPDSKDGTTTFTLLSASNPIVVPPSSTLEAENQDCSVPIPPSFA